MTPHKTLSLIVVLSCFALLSCTVVPPTLRNTLRDTKTVSNPEATHIWLVQESTGGMDRVWFCDSSGRAGGAPLCIRYPEVIEQSTLTWRSSESR
jgi:hypothetical protein